MEGRNCGWWAEGVDWLKKNGRRSTGIHKPEKNNNNKQNSG